MKLEEQFLKTLPQVSADISDQLDRPLQFEISTTVHSMQAQKALGKDGLTVEFDKGYWDSLSVDLLQVLNQILATGFLPLSCIRAVTRALCVDLKILFDTFASMLMGAMEQVIHQDQTFCVPGRSMADDVFLILRSLVH